jgi:hypothetical protein
MTITRMQEPRQMYQQGGIMQVAPRQGYFLGKLVKSIGKGVKKIVKSPVGKAAILGAVGFGIPGTQFGGLFGKGALSNIIGQKAFQLGPQSSSGSGLLGLFSKGKNLLANMGTGTKLGLGGAFASYLMSTGASEEEVEEIKRDKGKLSIYLKDYFTKLNPDAKPEEIDAFVETNVSEYKATGGRVGLMGGAMPTGIMRTNQAGTIERDYRDEGGFVPVGIKEKADDVPAMLSKNEFVMTADAVRGMGNGSIEKGAQRLYDQMKRLENKVA